ncbi:V/A-type H+-transporting ATPase subunit C [Aequitasia blattaphilus]|uniref:V-type ATPase subunit n=1 Tax=Aequitasia blattaphilus TaxID=2949332 RepID=A0ABT1E4R5_9FIRM|nr:V-type ATPase subunit [Aequitasia blattaphilus]MCP1100828.1 V-type ATPase subunit [Aequitasia blattaphilus]MCR8613468.1 V-type ATPase subunit [Aequitasia blattaphilus]
MSSMMAYSGIVTKIKAMEAKLLTEQDFEEISNMKNVPEVIEFLKQRPGYEKYINQMDPSLYHRRHVEKMLIQSLYDDYTRVYRFANATQRKFMKFYIKHYEVDLINYCLRILFNHYDWPFDLDYKKPFYDQYSQLSIDRLVTSKSVDDLIENIKDTEYYKPLQQIHESGAATIFDYDLALELYSFSAIWKSRKRALNKKELDLFTRDMGTAIDLINLQWIYRAKKYYNMLAPDIYSMTIPVQYRFSVDEFKDLVEAPSVDEFIAKVQETSYAKKYNIDNTKTLEQMYNDCMIKLYLADRRSNPYSVASINTYFFLKETEITKLTTALECIRYGLSSREILGYIGGVIQ